MALTCLFSLTIGCAALAGDQPEISITDCIQPAVQMRMKDGISTEDEIQALMSRAAEINLKFITRQQASKELEACGLKTPYLAIFQRCDPEDARQTILNAPIHAAHMPGRNAMVETRRASSGR